MGRFKEELKEFFNGRFSLADDNATQEEVEGRIRGGVVIRGTNLWVLIFATFIASIGLNVNSAAVIIGAMLISPLMGPIMGMGMSLAINDFDLLKRSLKNFGFMMLISIITSTIYFAISPLANAQGELIARTQPTTLDVLVALFGGLAGIVAQTRRDKTSTVIPGVAIATALMPPLCTAGFGLATGQFNYFFGAFYLFIINTVFIAIGTYLIINFLKYEKKQLSDVGRDKKVRRIMSAIIIITIVPSVFIGYDLVKKTVFEENVKKYVAQSFNELQDTRVVDYKTTYKGGRINSNEVDIVLLGKVLSDDAIDVLRAQMSSFGLSNTVLSVKQGANGTEVNSSFIQANFEELLQEKNGKIESLQNILKEYEGVSLPVSEISRELSAFLGFAIDVAVARSPLFDSNGKELEPMLLCYIKCESNTELNDDQKVKLVDYLKVRAKTDRVKFIFDNE